MRFLWDENVRDENDNSAFGPIPAMMLIIGVELLLVALFFLGYKMVSA